MDAASTDPVVEPEKPKTRRLTVEVTTRITVEASVDSDPKNIAMDFANHAVHAVWDGLERNWLVLDGASMIDDVRLHRTALCVDGAWRDL